MRELPKQSNLHRRNGRFYIRVRVPKELVHILNKAEIKKSLGTSDKALAMERLSLEMLKLQQLFSKERKQLKSTPLARSPEISTTEIERVVVLWHQSEIQKIERSIDAFRISSDIESLENARQTLREDLTSIGGGNANEYMQYVLPALESAMFGAGLEVPKDKALKGLATNLVHQGLIEQTYRELELLDEHYDRTPFSFFASTNTSAHSPSNPSHSKCTLQTLCAKFSDARISDGVTLKSMASYKLTIDFAIELFGSNKSIETITREDCRTFRNKLSRLPSNAKKKYPRLSLLGAIKAHHDDATRLSTTSVNRHLINLATIFKFGLQEGYLEKNPAAHIKQLQGRKKKEQSRAPFSSSELQAIFKAPIYTGCENDNRGYRNSGNNHPRRHRFWVPLISLFTGMRLNEICQLLVDDIREESGIYYIKVEANEDEENTLKTAQSERVIPIHHELMKIGFLHYVSDMKSAGNKRLFPSITPSASGSLSANFTKWFRNFLTSIDVKKENLCFHSFRHTFRDAMREANFNREMAAQIGGWKNSDSVMDEYGDGFRLESLNREMQTIKYEKLDLRYIHMKPFKTAF